MKTKCKLAMTPKLAVSARLLSFLLAVSTSVIVERANAWTRPQTENSSGVNQQSTRDALTDDKTRLETILGSDVPLERFAGQLQELEVDLARLAAGLVPAKSPEPFKDIDPVTQWMHKLHELSRPLPKSTTADAGNADRATDSDEPAEVSTKLPYENAAASSAHLEQARQHAANATACAQRALACQQRARQSLQEKNAESLRHYLGQIVYFAWLGRRESHRSRESCAAGLQAWLAQTEGFESIQKSNQQTVEEFIAQWQDEVRSRGLSKPYALMMRDAGLTDEQLNRHRDELLALDPKRSAKTYERLRDAATQSAPQVISSEETAIPKVAPEDVVWARLGLLWATALQKLEPQK